MPDITLAQVIIAVASLISGGAITRVGYHKKIGSNGDGKDYIANKIEKLTDKIDAIGKKYDKLAILTGDNHTALTLNFETFQAKIETVLIYEEKFKKELKETNEIYRKELNELREKIQAKV